MTRAKIAEHRRAITAGFFRGLGAVGDIYSVPAGAELIRSDLDSMRSDWEAVGNDLREAMRRVNEQAEKQESRTAA